LSGEHVPLCPPCTAAETLPSVVGVYEPLVPHERLPCHSLIGSCGTNGLISRRQPPLAKPRQLVPGPSDVMMGVKDDAPLPSPNTTIASWTMSPND
jgi:hypothetical protein